MGRKRGPCAGASQIGASLRDVASWLPCTVREIERDTADRLKVGNHASPDRRHVERIVRERECAHA